MVKVYVCKNPFPEVTGKLAGLYETRIWDGEDNPARSVLLEEVRDIEGLLTVSGVPINAEVIKTAPKLKVISTCSVGYDHIDIAAATARGIAVGYLPYVLTETTADLAFGLLLTSARRIPEADAFVRKGKWTRASHMDIPGVNVNNTTLGIIGFGRIGAHMARRAKAFNMRVLYFDIRRREDMESLMGVEFVPRLYDLLSQSDFVTVHASLNETSRHMISTAEFAVMKRTAILINAARGPIVDPQALYQALKSHQILRAALDVTEAEPIHMDDPLLTLDNLIITPHIGSLTVHTRKQMMITAVENLIAGLGGKEVPYCANPEVYNKS